jgi:cysteine desulfurase
VHGGGQESHRRAGTENVPGIVGLGEAARLAWQDMEWEAKHCSHLRDTLIAGVLDRVPDSALTGHPTQRLPNNASFCIAGVEGESLLLGLDTEGIAVSTGSACTSGSLAPSHVLLACGIPPRLAQGSLRATVGRGNTLPDVDEFLSVFPSVVERLRRMVPASREA